MYTEHRVVVGVVCCGIAALVLAGCGMKDGEEGGQLAERSVTTVPAPSPDNYPVEHYAPSVADTFGDATAATGNEKYGRIHENDYLSARANPLSTFSIDADGASYANVRRFIGQGTLPPADAVRIEELINYFSYDYPEPRADEPISVSTEVAGCPWDRTHRLVRIGIRGGDGPRNVLAANNLVFLIDVSGSMDEPDKLPLLKQGLNMLVETLGAYDRVAIVAYAGSASVVLEPTPGDDKRKILTAIDKLAAGGSTAGEAGINLAYDIASRNIVHGGNNHVVLATDGDFNAGASSVPDLKRLIEEKRRSGISLSVIGLGHGDINDAAMEQLADNGNGTYYYIDGYAEAERVMRYQIPAAIGVAASDVKIQVEFNPATVKEYRLIGYENRALAAQDFNDDVEDAGEIASAEDVTALYEVVPVAGSTGRPRVDPLKYQPSARVETGTSRQAVASELMTVKVRYKITANDTSRVIVQPVVDRGNPSSMALGSMKFAAAVAEWGLLLRDSKYKGAATLSQVIELAEPFLESDTDGSRAEFIVMVRISGGLMRPPV